MSSDLRIAAKRSCCLSVCVREGAQSERTAAADMDTATVLVVDNGAATVRIGLASSGSSTSLEPTSLPNCVARAKKDRLLLVGDAIAGYTKTHDLTLHRAHERGYVVNWDVERAIWERFLGAGRGAPPPAELGLLLTEAPLCPEPLRRTALQVVFEEFGFASHLAAVPAALALRRYLHTPAGAAAAAADRRRAALVVDAGFSFTHVVPCACGAIGVGLGSVMWTRPIASGVRRIDVGGKALTNILKEVVSFRHWNMMEEALLVNDIKERTAFVSLDFARDMHAPPPAAHYLLPDYSSSAVGAIVDGDAEASRLRAEGKQLLTLGIERFAIPETLFNPSDVGIDQCGVADATLKAVEACSSSEVDQLWSCVLVRGGTSLLPNFAARLEADLRALAPVMSRVSVVQSDECVI